MIPPLTRKVLAIAALALMAAQITAVGVYWRDGGFAGISYDGPRVEDVWSGYPAEAAGLQPGDVVTSVDGVDRESLARAGRDDVRVFAIEREGKAREVAVTYVGHTTSYLAGALLPGFATVLMSFLGMIAFLRLGSPLSFLLAIAWLAMGLAGLNGEALPSGVWKVLNGTLPPLCAAALVHFTVRFCHPQSERARPWILLSYTSGIILAAGTVASIYWDGSALTRVVVGVAPFAALSLPVIVAVSVFRYWRSNSSHQRSASGFNLLLVCPFVVALAIAAAVLLRPWGQYPGMALMAVVPWLTSLALIRRDGTALGEVARSLPT